MDNSHNQWRALVLTLPVKGASEDWIKGRSYKEISEAASAILDGRGGLDGGINGDSESDSGEVLEVNFDFWYTDLSTAVNAFIEDWGLLGFPDAGEMRHTELLPDGAFVMHTMLHREGGIFFQSHTELGEENMMCPVDP
jgi:hypothetical protein